MQCRLGRYFSNLRPITRTFDHCTSQVGQWRTTGLSEKWSRSRTFRAIWGLCRDQMDAKEVHFQLWWRQLYYSYASPTWICGLHVREKMMDRRGNGGVGWRCRAGSEVMHPSGPCKGFKWPERSDLLCVIDSPVTRNGRTYALSDEDLKNIDLVYTEYIKNMP